MRIAGKTRLLVGVTVLGISICAASWAAVQEFIGVATAVHKLAYGEVLREARPHASPGTIDPDSVPQSPEKR
jgi:hypothetical protein